MALPPRGHPDRPLRLAARSMMTLGVVLLIFSTCLGFPVLLVLAAGMAVGWGLLSPAVCLGAGVGFVVCSVNLRRHRHWAAIVGLALAGMGLLGALMVLVVLCVLAVAADAENLIGRIFLPLVPVLFIAAFTQLIVHLSKSLKAIRIHEIEAPKGYGFVPIMGVTTNPAPTAPPTAGSAPSAAQ